MRKVKIIGAIGLTLFFSLLFLPAAGAIPWTFDNNVTVQGDLTVNGSFSFPITDNTIVDADINSAAAIDASKIGGGNVSTTEYDYLSEVTSDVQTQLVGKQAGSSRLTNLSSGTIQDNTTIYDDIVLRFGTDNDFTLRYKSADATLIIALDNGDSMCTFSKTGNLTCTGEATFLQYKSAGTDNAYGINVMNTEDPTGANLEGGLSWFNGTSNIPKQRNADNTATLEYLTSGIAKFSKCTTIDNAVDESDYPLERFQQAVTITTIKVYSVGDNVVGGLDKCTGTNGVCSSVTAVDADITATDGVEASDDGSLTNGVIAAGNRIRWHTTSHTGTNTFVQVCFDYVMDSVN